MQRPRPLENPRGDRDRGVSETIGFVLVFAILIITFSIYQGVEVPNQNERAEFQHNKRVQGELLNLRDAITRTATIGLSQTVSITVGADYPERTLAVNFGVTGGSVETVEPVETGPNNITITNANATTAELGDYWNVTNRSVETHDIVYEPTYTRYGDAPDTVLSNTAAFNKFQNTNISIADQVLIQGSTITLIAINGSLSKAKSGQSASVTVGTEALSPIERSITIEDNQSTTDKITITLPTSVADSSTWNAASLESQANVSSVTVYRNNITIKLKDGSYTLKMAQVGVGANTEEPSAAYIIPTDTPSSLSDGSTKTFTLEVRDAFNNPVDGAQVTATDNVTTGGTFDVGTNRVTKSTGSDGKVTFKYTAPSDNTKLTFNISGTNAGAADEWELVNKSYKIGAGSSSDKGNYLDVLLGPPQDLSPENEYSIVLVARNGTHSPVSGQSITAEAVESGTTTSVGSFQQTSKSTDTNGVAVFNYTAPDKTVDRVTFTFEYDGTSEDRKRVTFKRNISSGGGTDDVNPSGSGSVVLTDAQIVGNNNKDKVDLTFDNNDDSSRTIEKVRIPFYYSDGGGSNADFAEFNSAGPEFAIGDRLTTLNSGGITLSTGTNTERIDFRTDSQSTSVAANGDFFILVLQFENGDTNTYFVAVA